VISVRSLGKFAGYFSAFVSLTLFFMVVTFPMDKVSAHLEAQIESQTGRQVEIGEIDFGFSGLEVTDLGVEMIPGEGEDTGMLVVDRIHVQASVFDLLGGEVPDARIEADLLGGTIRELAVRPLEEGGIEVDLGTFSDLAIHQVPGFSGLLGLDQKLEGHLTLSGKMTWTGALATSEGNLQMEIRDAIVRAPQVKIPEKAARQWGMDSIQLSDLKLGTLDVKLALVEKSTVRQLRAVPGARDARALHLEEVRASGGDVELVVDPQSALVLGRSGMGASRVSVHAAVHLAEEFFTREVKKDDSTERPNLFLRTILQGSAQARAAEKNGYYGFQCRGLVSAPNCTLMKPTMRVGLKKPKALSPPIPSKESEVEEPEEPRERKRPTRAVREAPAPGGNDMGAIEGAPTPSRSRSTGADRERMRKERDERIRKLKESRKARARGGAPTAVDPVGEEAGDPENELEEEEEEDPEEESDEEPEEAEEDEREDDEEAEEDPANEEPAEERE
jgi:type II secretion system protein N